jgi:uncharacterized protein (DUF952 family)
MMHSPVIYHMTTRTDWEGTPPAADFVADTLASEGFVHCTADPERLLQVANRFYRSTPGEWVILIVATAQLTAPLRWETADGHLFPHVYGPIDRAAIVNIVPFPRSGDAFVLPLQLNEQVL